MSVGSHVADPELNEYKITDRIVEYKNGHSEEHFANGIVIIRGLTECGSFVTAIMPINDLYKK